MRVGQTPHRAMDFIVAEKMGWIDIDRETRSLFNGDIGIGVAPNEMRINGNDTPLKTPIPYYSTDVKAAMTVIEKLKDMGKYWITFEWEDDLDRWVVTIRKSNFKDGEWGYHSKWGAYDKSLPTAICRCVLRVMGVEEF